MDMDEVAELRLKMDSLNLELRDLLLRRLALAGEIIAIKKLQGREAKDAAREKEIIGRILHGITDLNARKHLKRIFKAILDT